MAMKQTFHVIPVVAAPGLWAVMLEDADGNWFSWPRTDGVIEKSIFNSPMEACEWADECAAQWLGTVEVHTR
jgi:hypothetical protein